MLGNTHLYRKEGINVWLLLRIDPRLHSATVSKVQKSHTGFAGRSLIGYSASVPDRFLQCSVDKGLPPGSSAKEGCISTAIRHQQSLP